MSEATMETAKPTAEGTELRDKKRGQTVRGVVVSDKMNKTRIIEVKRSLKHRLYQKQLVRTTRLFVHDEKQESHTGDLVVVISTRPISRHKNYRLLKILKKRVAE